MQDEKSELRNLVKQRFNIQFTAYDYYRFSDLIKRYGIVSVKWGLDNVYKNNLESPWGYLEKVIKSLIFREKMNIDGQTNKKRIKKLADLKRRII